jgi:ribosomal protein S18 acetylase RimI-like enzyme
MNIKIRQAVIGDLPILNNFQSNLVSHERPFDSTIPKDGVVEYYNIEKLITSETVYMLVAEKEGKIIGCAFGEIRNAPSWSVNDRMGYVGLFFVEDKVRGQGVGKSIINELFTWFKDQKISDIRLQVYSQNKNAIEAYRKYGFEDYALEMKCKIE